MVGGGGWRREGEGGGGRCAQIEMGRIKKGSKINTMRVPRDVTEAGILGRCFNISKGRKTRYFW